MGYPFNIHSDLGRILTAIVGVALAFGMASTAAFCTSVLAQQQTYDSSLPPIFGITIASYDSSIVQKVGSRQSHVVEIENTGVLELSGVTLMSEKIPPAWFSASSVKILEFGKKVALHYTLDLPAGSQGEYVFSLIAYGEHGTEGVSYTRPVALRIIGSSEGTSVSETVGQGITTNEGLRGGPQAATVQPVQNQSITQGLNIQISKELPRIGNATDGIVGSAISGFVAAIGSAKSALRNESFLLTVFISLLAIAIVLAVVMKAIS
jgi:hypothetical protein